MNYEMCHEMCPSDPYKAYMACTLNCRMETEGLLKVTVRDVHCT